MADTLATPAGKIRKVFPDLADKTLVSVYKDTSGTLHGQLQCWSARGSQRTSVSLSSLRPTQSCGTCLRAYRLGGLGAAGTFFSCYLETKRLLGISAKVKDGQDTGAVLRRIKEHRAALTALQSAREDVLSLLGSNEDDIARETLSCVEEELSRLSRLLRSDAAKEALLEDLRRSILPDVTEYVWDTTATLVGIHPYQEEDWTTDLQRLVGQFSLRTSPCVLLLPLYAAEQVRGKSRAGSRALAPLAVAPGLSPEVLETAALLWEPESSGPLQSLAGALLVARQI